MTKFKHSEQVVKKVLFFVDTPVLVKTALQRINVHKQTHIFINSKIEYEKYETSCYVQ